MNCRKCGRPLKTIESIKAGIGPTCERAEIAAMQVDMFEPDPVEIERVAPGVPEGIGTRIADLVALVRQAEKRLGDTRFSRRVARVLGDRK